MIWRARELLALSHYEAYRAGQWPPLDHHPAGGGQQAAYFVLALDVAFPAAHQPLPGLQGSEDRLGVSGSVQKSASNSRDPDDALAWTRLNRPRS